MTYSYMMTEEEKYYFDLQGYLIVRGVLAGEEIREVNDAIDLHAGQIVESESRLSGPSEVLKGSKGRLELRGMLGWDKPHRTVFRKMLVHPVVVSRLNELSGPRFRLDHGPLMIAMDKGSEGFKLHGSGEPFGMANWYHVQNGRIRCRGITVAWQLTDCGPGDGGFAIVPGSHKSQFRTPPGVIRADNDMDLATQPQMKAGDVLFFAETATHGTMPWTAEHQRRSILFKYASRGAARSTGKRYRPEQRYGDWVKELPPEHQSLMYGPGNEYGEKQRPTLESDGTRVWVE